jgi:hypothetical protein
MPFEIARAEVWAGEVDSLPGALTRMFTALKAAGVDLESAVVRPAAPFSTAGVLFVAPLVTSAQQQAARQAGLRRTSSIHAVRVAGPDSPGLMADLSRLLDETQLRVLGLSSTAFDGHGVHYFRFESAADADRAVKALQSKLGP